jgi:hypothetical protein
MPRATGPVLPMVIGPLEPNVLLGEQLAVTLHARDVREQRETHPRGGRAARTAPQPSSPCQKATLPMVIRPCVGLACATGKCRFSPGPRTRARRVARSATAVWRSLAAGIGRVLALRLGRRQARCMSKPPAGRGKRSPRPDGIPGVAAAQATAGVMWPSPAEGDDAGPGGPGRHRPAGVASDPGV